MPYFFILPAYLIFLLALFGLAITAWFIPQFKSTSGYICGGAVGSLIGFLLTNALVLLIGIAPVWLAERFAFPEWVQTVGKLAVLATFFIGPFIGSALGVLLGFATGLGLVFLWRNRTAHSRQFQDQA